jgi:hypothetical protein
MYAKEFGGKSKRKYDIDCILISSCPFSRLTDVSSLSVRNIFPIKKIEIRIATVKYRRFCFLTRILVIAIRPAETTFPIISDLVTRRNNTAAKNTKNIQ